MIEQARSKNVYDDLKHLDILEYLKSSELNFDYYFAADVFIYVGNLSDLFHLIKTRNKKSGKLLFSTEHSEGESFYLEKSGRYSHSKNYIVNLCREFNFYLTHFSTVDLRKENDKILTGGIYLLDF